jgi:hypothetical protein
VGDPSGKARRVSSGTVVRRAARARCQLTRPYCLRAISKENLTSITGPCSSRTSIAIW